MSAHISSVYSQPSSDGITAEVMVRFEGSEGDFMRIGINDSPLYNSSWSTTATMSSSGHYTFTITEVPFSETITIEHRYAFGDGVLDSRTHTVVDDPQYPSFYHPSFYPEITHQWVLDYDAWEYTHQAASCLANALATVKSIHEQKEGKPYQRFSIGWIYGNRKPSDNQDEGMQYLEALNNLKEDGVPYHDLLPNNSYYPDAKEYDYKVGNNLSAKEIVSQNYNEVVGKARSQRIQGYSSYLRNDAVSRVKEGILSDGCAMWGFDLYPEFENVTSDGIVPRHISGTSRGGHVMVILGWKKIGSINYWICQNSWGDWFGDNGYYYVPFYNEYPQIYYIIQDLVGQPEINMANRGSSNGNISVRAWYQGNANATTCKFYCNGALFDTVTNAGSKNWTTPDVTKSGLTNNVVYTFNAVFFGKNNTLLADTGKFYFESGNDWNWWKTLSSGSEFYGQSGKTIYLMQASHWNDFTSHINTVRARKGLSNYSFTSASSGTDVTAAIINQAIIAINEMLTSGYLPTVSSGVTNVSAKIFNDMKDKLNSIS